VELIGFEPMFLSVYFIYVKVVSPYIIPVSTVPYYLMLTFDINLSVTTPFYFVGAEGFEPTALITDMLG